MVLLPQIVAVDGVVAADEDAAVDYGVEHAGAVAGGVGVWRKLFGAVVYMAILVVPCLPSTTLKRRSWAMRR